MGKDVAATAGNLRADDHATMTVVHDAVADDDVLGGLSPQTTVVITTFLGTMTDEQLMEAGIAPDLIRFSVGIENVEDIIADLKQALDQV